MRFFALFIGFLLVVSLCDAAVVQKRPYRNTEEILVPVAIIQDGEEIKEPVELKEKAINVASGAVADDIAAAVAEEQKLEAVEAVVQAQRRIDEAIVEEEIIEAVKAEQNKDSINALEEENKLRTPLAEEPHIVAVVQSEDSETIKVPVREADNGEKLLDYKSVNVDEPTPNQVVVLVEPGNVAANDVNNDAKQPEVVLRQATQATPSQTTTQQNFVQQLIQNSPLGQFFNQITGQTTQNQVANDETLPAPSPTLPGLFNPVTAVQNAAQSVVNSTTQAFQGLQQFASNLGNQFQNTLSGLGGQQTDQAGNDVTTARPPGPIQQLVNTFIGNPQQAQPAPTQQGPFQGILSIFQGNTRPQGGTASSTNPAPEPAKEPNSQEQTQTASAATPQPTDNSIQSASNDEIVNEVRDSGESGDSFEESVQPSEIIVVNDDAAETDNDPLPEAP